MKDIVVYGTGGAAKGSLEIIDSMNEKFKQWNLLGFLDDDIAKHGSSLYSIPILGDRQWLVSRPEVEVVVGIADPGVRRRLVEALKNIGHSQFATLIHPAAWVARRAEVGLGSVIYAFAALNAGAAIGDFVHINMQCAVGHDVVIDDFVTLAPGVSLLGGAAIQKGAQLGANSVVLQGKTVGAHAVLGAGAVATKNVAPETVSVGVPARVIKQIL